MTSGSNKIDNKSYKQLLIIQDTIEDNIKDSEEETKNLTEDLIAMIASMMGQIKISKSSLDKKDSPKQQDTTTLVPDNKKALPLEGGNSTKMGGMWNLKNEISSPTFYELLVKIKLKGDTDLDLNIFYNNIKMYLNAVNRL